MGHKMFNENWLSELYDDSLQSTSAWQKASTSVAEQLVQRIKSEPKCSQSDQFREITFNLLGKKFLKDYMPYEEVCYGHESKYKFDMDNSYDLRTACVCWLESESISCATMHSEKLEYSAPIREFMIQCQRVIRASLYGYIEEQERLGQLKYGLQKKGKNIKTIENSITNPCCHPLLAIIELSSNTTDKIQKQLIGRRLSPKLRRFFWLQGLCKEKQRSLLRNLRQMNSKFGIAVAKGIKELQLRGATLSPINDLIVNSVTQGIASEVKECYGVVLNDIIKVLNVIYVYDRSFGSFFAYWLFALRSTFLSTNTSCENEQLYELAMMLNSLQRDVYPSNPAIFSIIDDLKNQMETLDPEFLGQLNRFLIPDSEELLEQLDRKSSDNLRAQQNAFVVFLFKWIKQGFVGILRDEAALFYWDQCFLSNFENTTILNMCLALLFLLRDMFLLTADYKKMRMVFLEVPGKLYTADVIQAWTYLTNNGDPMLITPMNRFQLNLTPSNSLCNTSIDFTSSTSSEMQLPSLYISLSMKEFAIINNNQKINRGNIHESVLSIRLEVYFGTILLNEQVGDTSSNLNLERDGTVVSGQFDNRVFIVPQISIEQYDLEIELHSVPSVSIILFIKSSYQQTKIGCINIFPYEKQDDKWSILNRSDRHRLSPIISSYSSTPVSKEKVRKEKSVEELRLDESKPAEVEVTCANTLFNSRKRDYT